MISIGASDGKLPRVSIGLGVYNGERFLRQTLDSLLAQTYRYFELIICDNCSTDGTEEICRSYAAREPRIRYYRNAANIGIDRNFNLCFTLSRGEYFKWACGDDLCAPDLIECCLKVLDSRPDVVLCYPKTRLIDENGVFIKNYEDRLDIQSELPHKRLSQLLWNIWMCNAVFGLFRSSVLKRSSLFGSYSNSDLAFLAEVILYGPFVEVQEFLFFRRTHELSVDKYPSAHDRMVLFNPHKPEYLAFPAWKLFAAHLSAIHRAPLLRAEKLRCYSKMYILLKRRGRDLGEDLKVAAKYLLRMLSGQKETMGVDASGS